MLRKNAQTLDVRACWNSSSHFGKASVWNSSFYFTLTADVKTWNHHWTIHSIRRGLWGPCSVKRTCSRLSVIFEIEVAVPSRKKKERPFCNNCAGWKTRPSTVVVRTYLPVVPQKVVAEVSEIGRYRRGELLWCMDGRANPLMDRKVVGVVFFAVVAMVAATTAGCSVV